MVPPADGRRSIAALQNTFHCGSREKPRKRGQRPLGDSRDTTSKIGSDCSAVLQIAKKRPERCYHQPGPHGTQLTCVTQNESGDMRCAQHVEVRSPVSKSLRQELLNDRHVVE